MYRSWLFVITVAFLPATVQGDEIDRYIKNEMQKRHIPGLSLAIVQNGKAVKVKGYGLANVDRNHPVTEDTVFELERIPKP